jgi:hypothetical protein
VDMSLSPGLAPVLCLQICAKGGGYIHCTSCSYCCPPRSCFFFFFFLERVKMSLPHPPRLHKCQETAVLLSSTRALGHLSAREGATQTRVTQA